MLLFGNAYAADNIEITERIEDWNGVYLGLQAGVTVGEATHTFSNGAPTDDSDLSGLMGGAHLGYNLQQGEFVFGIEGDIEGGEVDGDFVNATAATSSGVVDMNWQASVRARLGKVVDDYLFYFTGGWAIGDFDINGGPSFPFPPIGGYSDTIDGWTAGVGIESFFTEDTTWRIEYRYTDFGEASGNLAPTFPAVIMPVDVQTSAIRFGISKHY